MKIFLPAGKIRRAVDKYSVQSSSSPQSTAPSCPSSSIFCVRFLHAPPSCACVYFRRRCSLVKDIVILNRSPFGCFCFPLDYSNWFGCFVVTFSFSGTTWFRSIRKPDPTCLFFFLLAELIFWTIFRLDDWWATSPSTYSSFLAKSG